MTKNTSNTRRTGFTLVELLIVIVVIGILSAMMMLSSTEAVTSAKANNIISNLRNLKTAALAWYTDSMDLLAGGDIGTTAAGTGKSTQHDTYWPLVKKYLSSAGSSELDSYYSLVRCNENDAKEKWYVVYTNRAIEPAVKYKLKARAASVGLLRAADGNDLPYPDPTSKLDKVNEGNSGAWVFMRVK